MNTTFYAAGTFLKRLATAFYILLKYLILLIFPHPLSYDYSYNQIKVKTFSEILPVFGVLVYLGLFIFAIFKARKRSVISFGILFFLIALSPVANIFLVIGSVMAERFLYIPSLGYCLIIGYLLIKATKTNQIFKGESLSQFFESYKLILLIILVITFAYSVKTYYRSKVWKDDVSLFGHDVKIATGSARAHYQWARSLSRYQYPKEENKEKQAQIIDEAIKEYKLALDIDIDYYGYRLLADCYDYKRDFPNAIKYYEIAKTFNNSDRTTFYNELGYLYLNTYQFEKALVELDSAIKYYPDDFRPHFNMAVGYNAIKKYGPALVEFQKSISLNPGFEPAYVQAGAILLMDGQYSNSLGLFTKASQIDPKEFDAVNYIGLAYQKLGDEKTASVYFEQSAKMRSQK